ncbi:MAG TPA: hypothetical protein VMR29_08415 [Candidatus Binatia bacterium]|nr:hypothetical protein [Candidatus Binatia bacterium]
MDLKNTPALCDRAKGTVARQLPVAHLARRQPLADVCSAAVVALGVFWFVTRAYG